MVAVSSGTAATIIDYTQGGNYYDGTYQDEVARHAAAAGFRLQPENDLLEPILRDEVQVLGRVVGVLRRVS